MTALEFLKIALTDYKVGAVTMSSKYAIQAVLKQLRPGDKVIVEYGAGGGVVTAKLLEALPSDAKLIAVEINQDFLKSLRFIKDQRLSVFDQDIVKLCQDFSGLGIKEADAVLSNVPLTFYDAPTREQVVKHTRDRLKTGGIFIVYQYSPLMLALLKKYFQKVTVTLEWRNFPPYFIMVAEK